MRRICDQFDSLWLCDQFDSLWLRSSWLVSWDFEIWINESVLTVGWEEFWGDLRSLGFGLARPAVLAVLPRPARHEFWPIGPCLGRRPGTMPGGARHGRHGVPCRHDHLRAMLGSGPGRAVPGRPVGQLYAQYYAFQRLSLQFLCQLWNE